MISHSLIRGERCFGRDSQFIKILADAGAMRRLGRSPIQEIVDEAVR
jgi:hypothetical protein